MTEKERKSKFIHFFDKMPEGIRCPHFWVLSAMLGCPYMNGSAYCYLHGILRHQKNLPVIYSNYDKMFQEVEEWLKKEEPSVLNMGELGDSLALEPKLHLLDRLIPLFEKQDRHKLLCVSKSANRFLDILNIHKPTPQVILSWSVSSNSVWEDFEKSAPSPYERLACAYGYGKRGWTIFLRVDPIYPTENWGEEFGRLVDVINMIPNLKRITLGTIRAFPNLPKYCPPSGVFKYCIDQTGSDKRLRLLHPIRKSIYKWLAKRLKAQTQVCKETEKMVKDLGFKGKCNCQL